MKKGNNRKSSKTNKTNMKNNSKSKKTATKSQALTFVNPNRQNITPKFSYESKIMKLADLRIHQLLELLGYDKPDQIFNDFAKHFDYFERPVVTKDGFIISHATDFLSARALGKSEMEVVIIHDCSIDDVIQFISFKQVYKHGINRSKLAEVIGFLTDYLTNNPSGKNWAQTLPHNKTRNKVAEILGVSSTTVHNVSTVGKNAELAAKVDNGEITNSQALSVIKGNEEFKSRKRFANLKITNSKGTTVPLNSGLNLKSIVLNVENLGTVKCIMNGSKVDVLLNGVHVENISHYIQADAGSDDNKQDIQHHVFLPVDGRFGIQLILRDLGNININDLLNKAA